MIYLFIVLIFGHCLADYPLQGDFLSKAKNRANAVPWFDWRFAMAAHVGIHAGFVFIIMAVGMSFMAGADGPGLLVICRISAAAACLEAMIHAITDDAKCCKKIGLARDQITHVMCKATWAAFATFCCAGPII